MKTSELTGAALDWAVAQAKGLLAANRVVVDLEYLAGDDPVRLEPQLSTYYSSAYSPSTNWAHGGPIIEGEKIALDAEMGDVWRAKMEYTNDDSLRPQWSEEDGPTPLIAAMRCYVASQLGDEVDVPDELIKDK